ncbi:MAG: SDR family NAD(P)-dependent oxidoreductase [Deltaproteobacteria bacterium]|nr:SDR family NAD(P)-dependent oxidoreductase [Deltaproteobacteria bacterium]
MSGIAIVTGGNRGLGLEVSTRLAERGLHVILTARDPAAAAPLVARGLAVEPRALDVTDPASIARLVADVGERTVDVLVSNAAVSLDGFDADVVARTLATNYTGATAIVDALAPRLTRGSRVVLVSSAMGELGGLPKAIRDRFDPPRDRASIRAALDEFLAQVRAGTHAKAGWPSSAYRISKAALNAWTRLAAAELAPRGILVNAACPGWVRTRMGGQGAPRSIDEGGASLLWAATLPPDGPTGGFFRDGARVAW